MKASLIDTSKINWSFFRMLVRWLLFVGVLLYILSGYGISESRAVESLTLGLITKQVAFSIHDNLIIPFALLMFLHILPFFIRLFRRISHRYGVKHSNVS
jgi:type IV secretory pathway TrbL component